MRKALAIIQDLVYARLADIDFDASQLSPSERRAVSGQNEIELLRSVLQAPHSQFSREFTAKLQTYRQQMEESVC